MSYGWTNIQQLTVAEAIKNSDTYAFFSLMARLADLKFRLDSDPVKSKAGKLVRDVTLPNKVKHAFSSTSKGREHLRDLGLLENLLSEEQ